MDLKFREDLYRLFKKLIPQLKPIAFIPNINNTEIYTLDQSMKFTFDKVYIRKGTYHIHTYDTAIGFIFAKEYKK